jgi:hypothetical protein
MSFQPTIPGIFSPARGAEPAPTNALPATEKQIIYAISLATKRHTKLPEGITLDRAALSKWIDANKAPQGRFDHYPSSKQVAFAERIARLKRSEVPQEYFRDRALLSRWIDSNKPR